MVRAYAGVLGYLAWSVIVLRAVLQGGSLESVMLVALCYLIVFAVIGATVGFIAESTIRESVRQQLANQLAAQTVPANDRPTLSTR